MQIATLTTITPTYAAELLNKNVKNRPLSEGRVLELSEEMASGNFMSNGETIKIDTEGYVLDGQHRLYAIIKSGVTLDFWIISGINPEAFSTIDTGKRRSAGDTLHIMGETNVNRLAAALNIVEQYMQEGEIRDSSVINNRRITNRNVMEYLKKYDGIQNHVSSAVNYGRLMSAAMSVSLHYLFSLVDSDKAYEFFQSLYRGLQLTETSPIYFLRQRLITNNLAQGKLNRRVISALTIKSWNAFANNEEMVLVRFKTKGDKAEKFPEIDGLDRTKYQ
jgi:hypothetical protein